MGPTRLRQTFGPLREPEARAKSPEIAESAVVVVVVAAAAVVVVAAAAGDVPVDDAGDVVVDGGVVAVVRLVHSVRPSPRYSAQSREV